MLEHFEIAALLPHRHPVLLLDRVLGLDPGRRIEAIKAVSGSEPCYAGLAEDLPRSAYAYPRSLLIESLGQAAALLWRCSSGPAASTGGGTLLFGALRGCRFAGPAFPGDTLRHLVQLDVATADTAILRGETWIGRERIVVVDALVAAVRPAGTGRRDLVQGRREAAARPGAGHRPE